MVTLQLGAATARFDAQEELQRFLDAASEHLTKDQVSNLVGCSPRTVRRMQERGALPQQINRLSLWVWSAAHMAEPLGLNGH